MAATIRERLQTGQLLLGTVITSPDPLLAELVAARFDLAWIDLEHSALDVADVGRLAIALRATGCATFARLPSSTFERLSAVLDVGVDGVVIPRVEDVASARDLLERLRYPPTGTRGFAARRASGYGRGPATDVACLVQIESRTATGAAPAIARLDGVDGLVVGTADMALDLGIDANVSDPAMRSVLVAVEEAAREAGKAFGIAASGDPQAIAAGGGRPPQITVYSADVRLYAQAIDDAAARVRAAAARRRRRTDADAP